METVQTWLFRHSRGAELVLDLGSGFGDKLRFAPSGVLKFGIEAYAPYVEEGTRQGFYDGAVVRVGNLGGFRETLANWFAAEPRESRPGHVRSERRGCAWLVDVLEHLTDQEARFVVGSLKEVFARILVFTPDGPDTQEADPFQAGGDEWQKHRSTWTREELEALGFRVAVDPEYHVRQVGQRLGRASGALFAVWDGPKSELKGKEDEPVISIVMSAYNRKPLVEAALWSIRTSKWAREVQVVICDDGSNDEHRLDDEVWRKEQGKGLRDLGVVRVAPEDKTWINPCVGYNKAASLADGSMLIVQSAECVHAGDVIDYVRGHLQPKVWLSLACMALDEESTARVVKRAAGDALKGLKGTWYNHVRHRPVGFHFCLGIMREDWQRLGGFDEDFKEGLWFDDNDILERAQEQGMTVCITDEKAPMVLHLNHGAAPERNMDNPLVKKNAVLFGEKRLARIRQRREIREGHAAEKAPTVARELGQGVAKAADELLGTERRTAISLGSKLAWLTVGIPTRGTPRLETVLWLMELADRMPVNVAISAGYPIHRCRNKIVTEFLKFPSATHLLFIDDDVVPPRNVVGRIREINKPVVTWPCPMLWETDPVVNVVPVQRASMEGWPKPLELPTGVFEVARTGFGCVAIERRVLEAIKPPWFDWLMNPKNPDKQLGEDVYFSLKARELGFPIYCDATAICEHFKHVAMKDLIAAFIDPLKATEGELRWQKK